MAPAVPRGTHPQQVAACWSSPPPLLPAPGARTKHARVGWQSGGLGSQGLRISQQWAAPGCPQGRDASVPLQVSICDGSLGRADEDGTKWPPWPTICCQKPTVPNQLASRKPVMGGGVGNSGRSQAPGSCPACWGSRPRGQQLWHGGLLHPRSSTPGSPEWSNGGWVWGDRQHLPQPINALHCQAGAGHHSRLEKGLFFLSQPLAERVERAGGGCWIEAAWSSKQGGGLPCPYRPLSLSEPCWLEGREAFGVPEGVSLGAPCH